MYGRGLLFDVGANRGDATTAALHKGYEKIIALEPAPKMFSLLSRAFIYNSRVVPLRFAVSDTNNEIIEFYECVEDGLSSMEKGWLTDPSMPYNGKPYRTISAITCTLDWLIEQYGNPDLVKIDVEGAESQVLAGLTKKPKAICLEWTIETIDQHVEQLGRLKEVNGYIEYCLQYITPYLDDPSFAYRNIEDPSELKDWIAETQDWWTKIGWKQEGRLRPTADVGMLWVR